MNTAHLVKNGDIIEIDIENNTLHVKLSDEEIMTRIEKLPEFKSNSDSPWLKRYSRFVTSADQGAVLI